MIIAIGDTWAAAFALYDLGLSLAHRPAVASYSPRLQLVVCPQREKGRFLRNAMVLDWVEPRVEDAEHDPEYDDLQCPVDHRLCREEGIEGFLEYLEA